MAETHSVEEARKRFETLPAEVKRLLYSQEMAIIIQKVGERNQLHLDQVDALYTETGQVLLGFAESNEFVEDIVDIIKVDQTKAGAIAKDVDEMLFAKIRDAMKKVYEENKKVAPIASAPTPVSATPMPVSTPPIIPKPSAQSAPPAPAVTHADTMLSEKTVQVIPTAIPKVPQNTPPTPGNYKKDPYREPAE